MARSMSSGANGEARTNEGIWRGRLRERISPILLISCVFLSIWVSREAGRHGFLDREGKIRAFWEEKGRFVRESMALCRSKAQPLATLSSSSSDQDCEHMFFAVEMTSCGQELQKFLNFPIFSYILVGTVLSFIGRYAYRQSIIPSNQPNSLMKAGDLRWMKVILFFWVLLGISFSVWMYLCMNANIVVRRREALSNMCDRRASMLQDQFNISMNHVNALAILLSTFHHEKNPSAMNQKTFAEYITRTAFERPLTTGVAYALKVTLSERDQFESENGCKIKKLETDNQFSVQEDYNAENLDLSPVQEEYAPVIFSQETASHIFSVDMMSGKGDRDNILRARASGRGALTSPFNLLNSCKFGVVITFAVYKYDLPPFASPEERIGATVGYLGAAFDVTSLVEKLLQQLSSKQPIIINVYDTTNVSGPIIMYGLDVYGSGEFIHVSNVDFGDPNKKHEMHCRFKQEHPLPWSAITTSALTAVIVLLFGHIFYAAINRIENVENDYREMKALKSRAEAADVAKSQFLATVSHEIRTPMNGVIGMLQMLMDTKLNETQEDFAATAQASGNALIALINEVLDQAKIESGKLELEAVSFNVRAILDDVLSLFSDKSQAKSIELAAYISDQVPEILVGDPGRFRQAISNLVGNSVKFIESGHVFVTLHLIDEVTSFGDSNNHELKSAVNNVNLSFDTLSGLQVVDHNECWANFGAFENTSKSPDVITILVTVEDTGVGIPVDAQNRIFAPFMQADSSTSRTYGGTGIGLSISKCLVELMGGKIRFVSKPGVGSTFSFTSVFKKVQKNSADLSEFHGMRGLVVDGKRIRAEATKNHLQRLGIEARIAGNTSSAISYISDACEKKQIDMVFVEKDAWGQGSGLLFCHQLTELRRAGGIKASENFPKLLILVALLNDAEAIEFKAIGYAYSLDKPLRLSTTIAGLQKALGKKRRVDIGHLFQLKKLLGGRQILVVDDNSVNLRVAAGTLKKYGAIVTCVDGGKAAVEMIRLHRKFDVCFMDVQMPEIDGFEATKQIRDIEQVDNTSQWRLPILAMTADTFQATREFVSCGFDGYVAKPFEEEQLYYAIARFFESELID